MASSNSTLRHTYCLILTNFIVGIFTLHSEVAEHQEIDVENDWQIEKSLPKPSRRSDHVNQSHGGCDFPSLSYGLERKGYGDSIRNGQPSLARKLAQKFGSSKSSLPGTLVSQQAKKQTSLSCHREQQLSIVQNTCTFSASSSCDQTIESVPKPSQCSFFTAGPTRLKKYQFTHMYRVAVHTHKHTHTCTCRCSTCTHTHHDQSIAKL